MVSDNRTQRKGWGSALNGSGLRAALNFLLPWRAVDTLSTHYASQFSRYVSFFRWFIPGVLSIAGLGYIIWEMVWLDGYPLLSLPTVSSAVLLGFIFPLLTLFTLTWAYRASQMFEQVETKRQREHDQLVTLNRIGEAVNQSLELETVLNRAIDQVLGVMRLESGEVRLLEDGKLVLRSSRRLSPEFLETERVIPVGQCLCGKVAQTGELIAIEDFGKVTRFERSACACENFQSVLSAPVRTAERVVGVIHVASRQPRTFDDAERAMLIAIGHQVGVAIEKARLHAQLKTLNQELEQHVLDRTRELMHAKEELVRKADALEQVLTQERRIEEKTRARIAHDLHDGVQQLIIGAMFESQAARDSLTLHPDMAVSRLTAAQDLLRRIDQEMRGAIYSLRPTALDAHGLVPAVKECATTFMRRTQVDCFVTVDGTPRRSSPDVEVVVFRIVQEALNNIEAHAAASQVVIRLAWSVRDLSVDILDDGKGFDVAEVTHETRTHLGLIGMRERAESVGGSFKISARVGEGTHLSIRVPVN